MSNVPGPYEGPRPDPDIPVWICIGRYGSNDMDLGPRVRRIGQHYSGNPYEQSKVKSLFVYVYSQRGQDNAASLLSVDATAQFLGERVISINIDNEDVWTDFLYNLDFVKLNALIQQRWDERSRAS